MIHSDVELLARELEIDIDWEIVVVTENSPENANIRDSIEIIDNVESLNAKLSNKSRQRTDAVKRIETKKDRNLQLLEMTSIVIQISIMEYYMNPKPLKEQVQYLQCRLCRCHQCRRCRHSCLLRYRVCPRLHYLLPLLEVDFLMPSIFYIYKK